MKIELRDYQEECVQTIKENFETGDCQIVQLPTGSGKTVILWDYVSKQDLPTLIIAPIHELVDQIYEMGLNFVDSDDIYAKRRSHIAFAPYLIMTIASFNATSEKNLETLKDKYKLIVFDEAHKSYGKKVGEKLKVFKSAGCKLLGLTATPERLDSKNLLDIYDELTYEKNFLDMISKGHLVDIKSYTVKTDIDVKKSKINRDGDFARSVLRQLESSFRNKIILEGINNYCNNKKTIVFCLSIEHARNLCALLRESGHSVGYVHCGLNKSQRKKVIGDFRSGAIKILCNVQLLAEGFDEATIEAVVIARPTCSKTLFCQMIGRGLRPYPGKKYCIVVDIADSHHDICNFNVMGAIPRHIEIEWKNGELLYERLRDEGRRLEIQELEYTFEEFNLFENNRTYTSPLMTHQSLKLQDLGFPFLEDISMLEGAYLLWKMKEMDKNGKNSREYVKKRNHKLWGSDTSEGL